MNCVASTSQILLFSVISNVIVVGQVQQQHHGACLLQGSTRIGSTNRVAPKPHPTNSKSLLGNGRTDVDFEPAQWNARPAVRKSHNCYEYALNDLDPAAADRCEYMLKKNPSTNRDCRRWFHIPGYRYHQQNLHEAVQFNRSVINCQHMMERVALDGAGSLLWAGPNNQPTTNLHGKSWKHDDHCPMGAYMASLVVLPGRRFHFYRRDHMCFNPENKDKRCWSHKPGVLNATRFDAQGQEIPDLHKADRSYGKRSYTDVCGFFCVPANNQMQSDFYKGGRAPNRWAVV